ncbi:hypothetical protein ASPZODRAFT_127683 [Penicilliopsis zonata CBS 506.65]|uniref:hydroxyisourate hydrolase n=1 Tax=Penicilliopsis zonata CBS 506.65 TaxID=1073090 RepID=A0A1L9SWL0_9EURO|nr:hypothetical protein ASPZODRAFT_127683 [Penicilliopsis zonata CBS 506.65]OJJ51588.1 hypothetical protein ASPZODRAFT_127683 [Penicilliopsis zonata CBS 506.65]
MDTDNQTPHPAIQVGRITDRLALYQRQLEQSPKPSLPPSAPTLSSSSSSSSSSSPPATQHTSIPMAMARDPITCHVLNTLTGSPAANLPVTLTLVSSPASQTQNRLEFHAVTDSDGRVKTWTPKSTGSGTGVVDILGALPTGDSRTNWQLSFAVGAWFEAQGVESFWPEVDVKFTVKGRGREGEDGWRHYHVPVLLGPWNYSTYRGS